MKMTTILVVDDHTEVRNSIATISEMGSYDVLTASNGEEAIHSPELAGFEVLRILRDTPETKRISFAFITELM
jgi:CheY-like chemotaxis protein